MQRAKEALPKKMAESGEQRRRPCASERAMKQATKDAITLMYKEDEHGRLTDPGSGDEQIEIYRKLEKANEKAMKDLKASHEKRHAEWVRQQEEAKQRELVVQAARLEVATTFKQNQRAGARGGQATGGREGEVPPARRPARRSSGIMRPSVRPSVKH